MDELVLRQEKEEGAAKTESTDAAPVVQWQCSKMNGGLVC
jgi:hypothetical protein